MLTSSFTTLLLAAVAAAAPLYPRATLDPAATAEAQQRDGTATRAFSDTTIKTGDGRCLQVTSGTGDFRENLAPIEVADCNGSKGQQFDVITAGAHNDQAGTALIVSSLTQACFNFDPRRAAGNRVITFSCGGRADGGGQVTDSQLFPFPGGAGPLSLAPKNDQGKSCFAVRGNVVDAAACANGAADQTFTFGAQANAPAPEQPAPPASTSAASAPPAATGRALTKLDAAATEEAQKRDGTATRAFSSTAIKTGDGRCLQVTSGAGDFRENLAPIEVADCNGSQGQQFDVITKGAHNDQANTALIVSSLTQACFNFDPRRAAGNQVITFSCGGRADGGGQVTDSQLFPFQGGAGPLSLAPKNDQGKSCFAVRGNVVDAAACSANDAAQTFTFDGQGSAAPQQPQQSSASAEPPKTTSVAAQPPKTTSAAAPQQTSGRALTKLDPGATAEAQKRDDSATRAFSNTAIKTGDGRCLQITSGTGDFRENLAPIEVADCNGSQGQQFDIITKGVHNDQANTALVVSSLTQACFNFDPRRAAGNQAITFSCGGRADGGGQVTDSQLFTFQGGAGPLSLAPKNAKGQTCFAVRGDVVDAAACNANDAAQTFTFDGQGAAAPQQPQQSSAPAEPPKTTSAAAPQQTDSGRTLTKLDPGATAEAQKRDDGATRAFSGSAIKTGDGRCLQVTSGAGDFRENLAPIEVADCNGSQGQQFDLITKGAHNDQANTALIVSSLTQACFNFDPRRAAGNQVITFSCGGRADGGGQVTDSQLFPFQGGAGPLSLAPKNDQGKSCFAVRGNVVDAAACNANDAAQEFTFA
ncbi:hypothetical protein C8Q74DRAFT_1327011 [Fomes fomentarius]|nr:hypothetical protein C8Q74DRAFT_1327011 [Fomes fomentarius]